MEESLSWEKTDKLQGIDNTKENRKRHRNEKGSWRKIVLHDLKQILVFPTSKLFIGGKRNPNL